MSNNCKEEYPIFVKSTSNNPCCINFDLAPELVFVAKILRIETKVRLLQSRSND